MITMLGSEFKKLVAAACKYPSLGSFAGSEFVGLGMVGTKLVAVTSGVTLARTETANVEGDLPDLAVDRRVIEAFASVCSESTQVRMVLDEAGKTLTLKAKSKVMQSPVRAGLAYKAPALKGGVSFTLNKTVARHMKYMSSIAYNDMSRAELYCLMIMANGRMVACTQKAVASFTVDKKWTLGNVALPLPLAREAEEADTLYIGGRETILKQGIARYSMPSLGLAQKKFPYTSIKEFSANARSPVAKCAGAKLAAAFQECHTCVGSLAVRTEVAAVITLSDKRLVVSAENGGSSFKADLPYTLVGNAQPGMEFRVPLESVMQVLPFLDQDVALVRGTKGDLYFVVQGGWMMFPYWDNKKKRSKKV